MLDASKLLLAVGILASAWIAFRLVYAVVKGNIETLLYDAALRMTTAADMIGLVRKTWNQQLQHRRSLQSSTTIYTQIGGSGTWDYSADLRTQLER